MAEIKAVRYNWGNYSCYLGVMTYSEIPKFIKSEIDQSMNRDIDSIRVREIIEYIKETPNSFFPPVILNSSNRINFDSNSQALKVSSKDFTIIDGQHRIRAITEIFTKSEYNETMKNIQDLTIPFLLIESLEPEMHRTLFNTINENATNVESTVSERFSLVLRNMIGLKYFSNHPDLKVFVEWEEKQSIDKVVYKHLTRCNDEIIACLEKVLKGKTNFNNQLIYKDELYYSIFEEFWNRIFKHIQIIDHERAFWVKFITLFAITKKICEDLNTEASINDATLDFEQSVKKINIYISEEFDKYLIDKLIFDYNGKSRQTDSTYKAIIDYLRINKELHNEELNVDVLNIPLLKTLINRYLLSNCLKGEYFNFQGDLYGNLLKFLKDVEDNKTQLETKDIKFINGLKEVSKIQDVLG